MKRVNNTEITPSEPRLGRRLRDSIFPSAPSLSPSPIDDVNISETFELHSPPDVAYLPSSLPPSTLLSPVFSRQRGARVHAGRSKSRLSRMCAALVKSHRWSKAVALSRWAIVLERSRAEHFAEEMRRSVHTLFYVYGSKVFVRRDRQNLSCYVCAFKSHTAWVLHPRTFLPITSRGCSLPERVTA